MEIYLIRHTTPKISKGLIYGRMDVALADSFETDKKEVLSKLPGDIQVVYSSPAQRCFRLAACISPQYRIDTALTELNFGDWEGLTWDAISQEESESWTSDFVHVSPPNGETMLQMEQRVLKFFNSTLSQHQKSTAIVTHGGVIRILLAHYRSIALKDAFSIPVSMGEVFKLSVSSL